MRKRISVLTAATLIIGFAVASFTGNRALGGVVLVSGGVLRMVDVSVFWRWPNPRSGSDRLRPIRAFPPPRTPHRRVAIRIFCGSDRGCYRLSAGRAEIDSEQRIGKRQGTSLIAITLNDRDDFRMTSPPNSLTNG